MRMNLADKANTQEESLIPRRHRWNAGRIAKGEGGKALTETVVVAGFILVPLFILGIYVGKWAYLQDRAIEAARYAAWERVVSPATPPKNRDWVSLKSDADLANEVRIRFFGGRAERLTAVTGSAAAADLAKGSSDEPLLRKHDGEPLLVKREENITVNTREEAFDGGWANRAMNALNRLAGNPMEMTGPTVTSVTVSAAGLPQRIFREVGLGNPLQFKAQAAVLADAWTANGEQEEERLLRQGFMSKLDLASRGKIPFYGAAKALYYLGLPLGGLFNEVKDFVVDDEHANDLRVDTSIQFGDRLQPTPAIPPYKGP